MGAGGRAFKLFKLSAAAVLLLLLPGTARAETTNVQTETFSMAGAAQSWTVPAHVIEATFSLRGGSGGSGAGQSFTPKPLGGLGAHLTATLPLSPGAT